MGMISELNQIPQTPRMMGSDLQERDLFDKTILVYLLHKRKNCSIFLFTYNKGRQDLSR